MPLTKAYEPLCCGEGLNLIQRSPFETGEMEYSSIK